jgi:Mn2+/Fe2+ NRAMP family transporter
MVPVLRGSAASALAEALGWQRGPEKKPCRAKQFYAVIVGATLVGMLINFADINPIAVLFWTAVINGVPAPSPLVLLMLIANNRQVMGERVNGRRLYLLGWLTTLVMGAAALALLFTWGNSRRGVAKQTKHRAAHRLPPSCIDTDVPDGDSLHKESYKP